MKRFYLIFVLSLSVASCKQASEKVVNAITSTILEPVSMSFSTSPELGEMAISVEPIRINVEIKNNSSDDIRKLNLSIDSSQNLLKFYEDSDGVSITPGYGGTCTTILGPGKKCIFALNFTGRKIGNYNIPVVFQYENLIKPQSRSFNVTAIVGEPATLSFTNELSNYDLGVIEQTDPDKKYLDLEIKNSGGLSAKNIIFNLDNDNSPGSYEIEDNQCPTTLPGSMSCKIRLSYRPYNTGRNDAPVLYTGKFSLGYTKDPQGNSGKLNAYFSFLSATIEANFKQNFSTIEFNKLVAGNKQSKTVKLTNAGYRPGILKELNFYNDQNNLITKCIKGANAPLLNCQLDLINFPFIVEDSNNCMEREVEGVVGKNPGEGCFFKITYWPSTTYLSNTQSTHYFNESTISAVYDSQWRGVSTIVTKSAIFTILADFYANGKLVLEKIEVENVPLLNTDIIPSGNIYEANLGRLALVSDEAYLTYIKVTLKNVGENPVTMKSITDGATPTPHEITDVGQNINAYYKSIKHNSCTTVAEGATCNFSFNLNPKVQLTSAEEDVLMFDNYSNPLKKYKQFKFIYLDGGEFEDNGDPANDRSIDIRMISQLVRKGYLTIDIPAPSASATNYVFPTILHGNSSVKNVLLKNVGTGDIYAVIKDATYNLDPKAAQANYPFRVLDVGTPTAPATKDCYDIVYAAGSTAANMPATPDNAKFLAPGESCVLSIENKLSETVRMQESDYLPLTSLDWRRPFSPSLNNTNEMWERKNGGNTNYTVNFKYYDGDTNPSVPSSLPYGYQAVTKNMTVSSSFSTPANVVVKDPEPTTSALFARPPLNYPSVNSLYPISNTLAAKTVVETYFDSSYFTLVNNGFSKSIDAINHFKTLGLTGGIYNNEYKFHAGTFPINQLTSIGFKFANIGGKNATTATLTEEPLAVNYPIQTESFGGATAKPYPSFTINANSGVLQLKLQFLATAAGLYKRCYTLTYESGLGSRDQYVCVYAEAVATAPKIKMEYKDVTVTQTGASVSEAETASFVTLNTPMNSQDITSISQFSAVRNSIVYAKKRFKFTNIGNADAAKFNRYYMDSIVGAAAILPNDTTITTTGLAKPCTANMTLVAGDFCEIYIKYMPTTSSSAVVNRYLGTIFEISAGSNQYIAYTGYMQFLAIDPANLVVNAGVTTEVVTDWSNPTTPIPLNASWPVNVGAYSTAVTPPHFLLTSVPSTKSILNYEVKNTSTLKASLLAMNPAPGAGAWNTILSNPDVTILANRYCFYGDDEANVAIAAEDKGFNNASINKCYLQINFSGSKTYESCSAWNAGEKTKVPALGQNIVANCNPFVYPITYWNFKRAAQSQLYIHMKGFIEPNRVTAAVPTLSNVSAVNSGGATGSVTFSWPALSPTDGAWGSVTKYRVYYSSDYSTLSSVNAFKLTSPIPSLETTDSSITSITIPNLVAGQYYYFKVFAVRSYTGVTPNLTYLANSNLPILTVPIPQNTQVYNHSLMALIDKSYKSTPGTRTTNLSVCTADYYNLTIGGAIKKAYKTLINSTVFNYLNTSASLNTGYPGNEIGSIPHWLSDSAYTMTTSISLYNGTTIPGFPNYNSMNLSGNNPDNQVLYQKSCTNNASCDQLFKVVGGDGNDLYYKGAFYTTALGISAYARCYGVILCPTNTTKLITDGTCVNP